MGHITLAGLCQEMWDSTRCTVTNKRAVASSASHGRSPIDTPPINDLMIFMETLGTCTTYT